MSEGLARIQRRAGRILRQLVPYNGRYRPVGVHPSSKELAAQSGGAVRYHEIVGAHTSYLNIPEEYYKLISSYEGEFYGKPSSAEDTPAAFALEIPNGRIYADNWENEAVINADGKLIGDVSFQHANGNMSRPEGNSIFKQRYFLAPAKVTGTVCSLLSGGGAAMGNYFHWLVDSVARLHLVREAGLFYFIDYFLVPDKKLSFVRDSLAGLGIRPEQILDVTTHRHLQADRLIVTSPVRGTGRHTPEWATAFLGQSYLPLPESVRKFGPHVYVSRRDAQGRYAENEADIQPILQEFGFESYTLSQLSFLEKVSLFNGAKLIISPVGAGLANLVFCRADATLLELHPDTFIQPEGFDTSTRVGMSYRWLVCPTTTECKSYSQARFVNFTVPPAELRQALVEMTSKLPAPAAAV